MDMDELEKLAKEAEEQKKRYGGYLVFSGFHYQVTPPVVLRLVAIARAAEALVDDYDCHAEPKEASHSCIAALREALEVA